MEIKVLARKKFVNVTFLKMCRFFILVSLNVGKATILHQTEKRILSSLLENASVKIDELMHKIVVSKHTIQRVFKSLQEKGYIKKIKTGKEKSWLVIK